MSTSPQAPALASLKAPGAVVIYGGTFDPPHAGHLAVAEAALKATQAASLHWVVGGEPPHKPPPGAPAQHRLGMVQVLTAHEPRFQVEAWDLERQGPSYAVDTLRLARQALGLGLEPMAMLWVLGADAMAGLHTWHEAPSLAALTGFLVVSREGFDEAALRAHLAKTAPWLPAEQVHFLTMPPVPASSSALRQALADGAPTPWLPPAVAAYVAQHALYPPKEGPRDEP